MTSGLRSIHAANPAVVAASPVAAGASSAVGERVRVAEPRQRQDLPRHQDPRDHDQGDRERDDHQDGRRRPDRRAEVHHANRVLEEVAARGHEQRGARRQPELPDRLGRGHGGKEEREVHRDALFLGRGGEVDGDERPQGEAEAPVEVGGQRR